MCRYVDGEALLPGVGCCWCRTYNGLQRDNCRRCGRRMHLVAVPDYVVRCKACGWGRKNDKDGEPVSTLAGRDVRGICPACTAPWPSEVSSAQPA